MRACVPASLLVASLLLAYPVPGRANDGVYLPQSPVGPGGEDSVETAEGTRCRQSMNSNGAYADMGVVGNKSRQPDYGANAGLLLSNTNADYALAYARVTIPLGSKPKRIDCTRLYDMEIARLKREIELMKLAPE